MIILGMVPDFQIPPPLEIWKSARKFLTTGFWSCEIPLMKSIQVCPGPKNCVFVSKRTSYSRHKTSCTVLVDKVKHLHFCCFICEFIFFC